MASSIINSDDGSVSGTTGLKTTGGDDGALEIQSVGTKYMTVAAGGDISFYEDTGTTAKFFWDASAESLGIGTSSPTDAVHVSTSNASLLVENTGTSGTNTFLKINQQGALSTRSRQIQFQYQGTTNAAIVSSGDATTGTLQFNAGANTEAMRIDSSGNLLVGPTSEPTWATTAGHVIRPNSSYTATRDGAHSIIANRLTSDGDIVQFRKDGTTVGSIGVEASYLHIEGSFNGAYGLKFVGSSYIRPCKNGGAISDNELDWGASGSRFDDIYATNGTIQTSDRNEKQDIEELSEAETRAAIAAKGLLKKFRWKDAVAEKGDEARIHFGIIAQDLQAAFEAEGLDAGRYAMFIHTTWWETYTDVPAVEAVDAVYETQTDEEGNEVQVLVSEAVEAKEAYTRTDTYDSAEEAPEGAVEKSRMGVRYSELLAFIIAAI